MKKLCHRRIGLLVAMMLALSACGSKAEREAYYMSQAKAFMEKKQDEKASEQLNYALSINITNHEAYYQLGLIQESHQQYRKAMDFYVRALEYNPSFSLAKTHLASMHLLLGQTAQADKKITAVLKADPTNAPAKTLSAEVHAKQGNLGLAIAELQNAKKAGIQSPGLSTELGRLYLRQGNISYAQRELAEAIEQYPTDFSLHADLAQAYMLGEDASKAEAPLLAMLTLAPNDFVHQARLASYYVVVKDLQKAETTLRNSVASSPADVKRVLALHEFLLRHRSPELAEAELQGFIQSLPRAYDLRLALADLYEETGQTEKAERVYQDIANQNFSKVETEKAQTRLALMFAKMGKASTAKALLDEVLKTGRTNPNTLEARGKIAMDDGDLQLAIADFRSALKQQPNSTEYIGLLARAHGQNKEPGLARELLVQAAKNNPQNLPIRTMLVELLIQGRDYKNAQDEVNNLIKAFPFDPAPRRLLDAIVAAQNTLPGADVVHANEENVMLPAVAQLFHQGSQYLAQEKYDEAVGEFQKALRVAPSAIGPLNGLVQAYLAKGRPDLALAKVKAQLHITSPTLHQAYFLLGQVHDGQKQPPEAVRAYQRALDIRPLWDAPYLALAQHYHARGEAKQAQTILETALRVIPGSRTLSLHLASTFEANKSYDRAIAEYEKLLKASPELDIAANNLATLLIDRRGDKASLERSISLTRRFQNSTQPAYLDTLGWAMIKNGQANRGLAYVEKALATQADVAAYHFHAGMAYQALGNKDKAKTHMLKALAAGTAFPGQDQAKALVAGL